MRCLTSIVLFALVLLSSRTRAAPQIPEVYTLASPWYSDADKLHAFSYSPRYASPAVYSISSEALPVTIVTTGHTSAHQQVTPGNLAIQPTVYVQSDGIPLSSYRFPLSRYAIGTPTYAITSSPDSSYAAAIPSYVSLGNYVANGAQSYIIADQGKSGGYATWPNSYRTQSSLLLADRTAYESAQLAADEAAARRTAEIAVVENSAAQRAAQQAAAQRAAQQAAAEHVAQQAALQHAAQQAAAQRAAQQAASQRAAQEAAARRAAQEASARRAAQEAAAYHAAQQAASQHAAQEAAAQQAIADQAAREAIAHRAAQEAAAYRAAQQAASQRAAQEAAARQAAANRVAQEAAAHRAAQQAAANRAAQESAAIHAAQQAASQLAAQDAAAQQATANERATYEAAQRAAAAQYAAQKAAIQYNRDSTTRYSGQNTGSLNGYYNTGSYGLIGNTGYIGLADRFGSGLYDYSGYGNYYGGYKTGGDWNNYYNNRYGSYYGGPIASHVGGVSYLYTGPGSLNFQNSAANAYTLRQSQYTGFDGSFEYAPSRYLGSCTITVGKPNRCAEFLLQSLLDSNEDPRYTSITFETDNGINVHAEGSLKNAGTDNEIQVITGSYSYVTPDGRHHTVHYVADENGFHARGEDYPLRKRSVAQDLLDVIKSEIKKHEKE